MIRVPRVLRVRDIARALSAIVGIPDYENYLRLARERQQADVLTREQFMRERLTARYDRPGSRCC